MICIYNTLYGQVKLLQPGNREWVTVIESFNASGRALPPYLIFKCKDVMCSPAASGIKMARDRMSFKSAGFHQEADNVSRIQTQHLFQLKDYALTFIGENSYVHLHDNTSRVTRVAG